MVSCSRCSRRSPDRILLSFDVCLSQHMLFLTNPLQHAKEIVLSAETRHFQPQDSRKTPLRIGALDGWLAFLGFVSFLAALYFSLH